MASLAIHSIGILNDKGGSANESDQDRCFARVINADEGEYLLGVFDGHEKLGDVAASVACDAFQKFFGTTTENWQLLKENPEEAMRLAFAFADESIKASFISHLHGVVKESEGILVHNGDVVQGGTTATVVAVLGNRIITANVGDSDDRRVRHCADATFFESSAKMFSTPGFSRCTSFIYECASGCPNKRMHNAYVHSPDSDPDSLKLLVKHDKEIATLDGLSAFEKEQYERAFEPSIRVLAMPIEGVRPSKYTRQAYCATMTRSLGDFYVHSMSAVISEPQVSVRQIQEDDCMIVLGSDGVWDVWTMEYETEDSMAPVIAELYQRVKEVEGDLFDAAEVTTADVICKRIVKQSVEVGASCFGDSGDNVCFVSLCFTYCTQ